jgi:eukaryotic-like serine/threonine-protein kinase
MPAAVDNLPEGKRGVFALVRPGRDPMASDPRIQELLEELLESGDTPEEVCRHCPELLPELIERWQRLHACDAQLDAWFPESSSSDGSGPYGLETTVLPRIRGYEVQGVLGRGGMGVVYKAWHRRLNRPVALKMLLAGAYARPAELERFLREAEAVAGLRHENVVQVYDVGDVDGRPYFTMELVDGGSLAQKLAGTPQPAVQAAALVATIAEAIQIAHQSGIVHRDLTPANILLTAVGAPKISDFGLARRLQDAGGLTQSGCGHRRFSEGHCAEPQFAHRDGLREGDRSPRRPDGGPRRLGEQTRIRPTEFE